MEKTSRIVLYGLHLAWLMERDKLDAHFCRFGCGFLTQNNVKEALEINQKINQSLIQIQKIQNSHIHTHPPLEQSHHLKSAGH